MYRLPGEKPEGFSGWEGKYSRAVSAANSRMRFGGGKISVDFTASFINIPSSIYANAGFPCRHARFHPRDFRGVSMAEEYNTMDGMRVLCEISGLIRSDSELKDKFVHALAKVKDAVHCHSASLFMYSEENGRLEEVATVGSRVNLIESIEFDLGTGFSAWVAKQRRSVLIPNLRRERSEGFRCFGSVPLITGEKLIGVMNLGHREPNALTEEHMQFLDIVAGQLANVIERARSERELIEKNEELLRAQDEIRKQQQQLIEMEKYQVLAQVAASINHEINNPLTTIMGNVDLILLAAPSLDPLIRKKLLTVLDEARRIAEITKKIRNIKRIVLEDYLERTGEKMIDINSSAISEEESENLSSPE